MYDFQKKIVNTIHNNRFTICKLPRQSGKSTTTISYLMHFAMFNPNSNIAILANKSSTARDILVDYNLHMKTYLNGCNKWLSIEQSNIELENKSTIVATLLQVLLGRFL